MEFMRKNLTKQISSVRDLLKNNQSGKVMLGWDGYLDIVWTLISERKSIDEYDIMTTMTELADKINSVAGSASSLEMKKKYQRGGGFTTNVGRTLKVLNVKTNIFGLFGEKGVKETFDELRSENTQLYSGGEPCYSNIFEFHDGKFMFSVVENMLETNWEKLSNRYGEDKLVKNIQQSDIIGQGYWSNILAFDDIMKKVAQIAADSEGAKKKVFLDFGNVKKRAPQKLLDSFAVFKEVADQVDIIVSLNRPELIATAEAVGINITNNEQIIEKLVEVREKMHVNDLVVHTPEFASIANENGTVSMRQVKCVSPAITTGAGDNFNAGLVYAKLLTDQPELILLIANATTSHYVTNGYPPNIEELYEYLEVFEKVPQTI